MKALADFQYKGTWIMQPDVNWSTKIRQWIVLANILWCTQIFVSWDIGTSFVHLIGNRIIKILIGKINFNFYDIWYRNNVYLLWLVFRCQQMVVSESCWSFFATKLLMWINHANKFDIHLRAKGLLRNVLGWKLLIQKRSCWIAR